MKRILYLICFTLMFSSCASIRTANRIEKAFLTNYKRDIAKGLTPRTYRVTDKYTPGQTEYNVRTGTSNTHIGTRSIDVYLIDTLTNKEVIIDNFKGIQEFTKNNKLCQPYIKKFKRQKIMQKVHRYGSYVMMVSGIVILSSVGENGTPTQSERRKGNTGAYILLAGFSNWIGGSLDRALMRRATTMKAAYVYHFGKPPKNWTKIK